jgi:hypothetical protein
MREDYAAWRDTWEACVRLANDPGATDGERENARIKAKQFRDMLDAAGHYEHYDEYVKHGQQAVKSLHNNQWTLGALAYNVQIEYGKRQLQRYADDIDVVYITLLHYRATWEAWPDVQGRPKNFSAAEVLNPHPHRYKIVAEFPDLTVRKATEIMRLYRDGQAARVQACVITDSEQQAAQPSASIGQQQANEPQPPPPPLTLEQAREVYVELALKLPMKERTREAIKLLNLLEVKMS